LSELGQRVRTTLGAGYRVESELGHAGMSRVFVAEELALGRRVVVKVLPREMVYAVSAERFRREIQLVASLQHPNIVPVLVGSESGEMLWYTMPLVEGESLRAKLDRDHQLPIPEAVRLLSDIADALSYSHQHGVVHRDLKPENVLLSGRHAFVTDFGIAKALSAAAVGKGALTSAGVVLGTPAYMAPEQAAADPTADHHIDLYTLGLIGYEMLTGTHPFAGRRAQQMLTAHAMEKPPPVAQKRPDVPPRLASLVMGLLEKRPTDRPESAEAVVRELETLATSGETTGPRAASRQESAHRKIVIAAVIVTIALLLMLIVYSALKH